MKKRIIALIYLCILCVCSCAYADNYSDAETYFKQADTKYSKKDYKGAIEDYNRAIELESNFANAYYNRGISYYKLKFFEEAEQDIKKARELFLKNYNYASAEKCSKISKLIHHEESKIFGQYMKELQKSIKSNWNPPKNNESNSVVVLFSIHKDGHFGEKIEIVKSSGNKDVDNAAIEAIKAASPFAPLPEKFNSEKVDIKFTFDYNVFGSK